jgi:FAD/FMN-containing dehydrogenase
MLSDQRLLAAEGRFEALQGAIAPDHDGWTFRIDAASFLFQDHAPDDTRLLAGLSDARTAAKLITTSYIDYVNRLVALERALRSNHQWSFPHPWLTTFVGDSAVESAVNRELGRMRPVDLGALGQVVLSPLARRRVACPLLRLPPDELVYAFNLVRIPATSERSETDRLVAANRAAYERIRDAEGTLYPVSAFPMSGEDWRRHFGTEWTWFSDAKRQFDPDHILTPGYGIF